MFLAMSMLEILIGTMSISRYGVMTVYRVIIMDLMSDIVWLIVLLSTISQAVSLMRPPHPQELYSSWGWGMCSTTAPVVHPQQLLQLLGMLLLNPSALIPVPRDQG